MRIYADASLNGAYPAASFFILSLKPTSFMVLGKEAGFKNDAAMAPFVANTAYSKNPHLNFILVRNYNILRRLKK